MPAGLTRFFGLFSSLWAMSTGKTAHSRRFARLALDDSASDEQAAVATVMSLRAIIYGAHRSTNADRVLRAASEILARYGGDPLDHSSLSLGDVSVEEALLLIRELDRRFPDRRAAIIRATEHQFRA